MNRRDFMKGMAVGLGVAALPVGLAEDQEPQKEVYLDIPTGKRYAFWNVAWNIEEGQVEIIDTQVYEL